MLGALITGDNSSRNARHPRERRERRRIVLAEAFTRVEQKFVDGMPTQFGWCQGVVERLFPELPQYLTEVVPLVGRSPAQFGGPFPGARIEIAGQLGQPAQRNRKLGCLNTGDRQRPSLELSDL